MELEIVKAWSCATSGETGRYMFDPPMLRQYSERGPEYISPGTTLSIRRNGMAPIFLNFPYGGIYHGYLLYETGQGLFEAEWHVQIASSKNTHETDHYCLD